MVIMFRIAMILGRTINELRNTMSARELGWWVAYLSEYPPERDADYRTALICDSIFKAAGSKRSKIELFLPDRSLPKRRAQTMEEQIALMKGFGKNANNRNGIDTT